MASTGNHTEKSCYPAYGSILSRGLWLKDNPLNYTFPSLMLQVTLFSILERTLQIILKHIGQPSVIPQILGGVILGPTVLGRSSEFKKWIFPRRSQIILDPFSHFSFIFIQLLIGLRMDPAAMFKTGRIPVVVGILSNFFPMFIGGVAVFLLSAIMHIDHDVDTSLSFIIFLQSMSASPVITNFLREVKILNSELGHLATSSSLISDLCTFIVLLVLMVAGILDQKHALKNMIGSGLSLGTFIMFIVFILRPAALWVNKNTPQGKPVREIYVFASIVALLFCALVGEFIGGGYAFGAFSLALAVPDGPALGATLEYRISTLNSVLFMPIFFISIGLKTDLFSINKYEHVWIVELIVGTCFISKAIAVILVLVYCKMPFRDAFTLALVMNSKGLAEIVMYHIFLEHKGLTSESFSILIMTSMAITIFISQIVRHLYDPTRQYLPYKRRTIQHTGQHAELGILACIHNQDNVPTIIGILEASNPTKESPIHLCVLHLVKLVGRDVSIVISHHKQQNRSSSNCKPYHSEPILKAFRRYAKKHEFVSLDGFTSISPTDTMHDDVCSLALKNRSVLIIIPFHNQWLAGGDVHSSTPLRTLNYNVLAKAPCSVGILVDRKYTCPTGTLVEGTVMYDIATLFIGGVDDREALSYCARMVQQPNVRLTVIRFNSAAAACNYRKMKVVDNEILTDFRSDNIHNDRIVYKEEMVSDGQGLVRAIRSMDNAYDLVVVGRRHMGSPLMAGLTEWTEYPELGIVGDILAAPEFHGVASIMVVQQQARVWGAIQQAGS